MDIVLKSLLKSSTQILKTKTDKIFQSENFIGTPYIAVKKGAIKTLDTAFNKIDLQVETTKVYEKLVPRNLTGYKLVDNIEVKKKYTQLKSGNLTTYIDTSFFIYFSKYIKNIKFYIFDIDRQTLITDSNDNVIGIVTPIKLKSEEIFKKDISLDELKKELEYNKQIKEIKKENEEKLLNETYNEILPLYKKSIDLVKDRNEEVKEICIKLNHEKTKYYFYIITNKKEYNMKNIGFEYLNKTQQKKLFKMLNDNLILNSNINDDKVS